MGGSGSTRWLLHAKKQTVEDGLTLLVTRIVGAIVPREAFAERLDWQGVLVWRNSSTGKESASMGYELRWQGRTPVLRLSYTFTAWNGVKQDLEYSVSLQSTPCNYGGRRWWFACPRCNRRVGKLYKPSGASRFACRHCHDLTYTSAQEAHKGDRLGGELGALIRQLEVTRRYERLREKYVKARGKRKAYYRAQMKKLWGGLID